MRTHITDRGAIVQRVAVADRPAGAGALATLAADVPTCETRVVGWLDGKVAVVTGASRGIGRVIALAYAREGADIVATARSTDALEQLAGEVGDLGRTALVVTADMAVPEDVESIAAEAVERFGRIDILVNNAGIVPERINLVDVDPQVFRRVVEVNLISVAMLTRAVLNAAMVEQGSGKIINISSIGGRRGTAGQTAYKATKAALINLTEGIAAEVKPYGIDVNCICPGGVDTEGLKNSFGQNAAELIPTMPAEAIADIALFLASDASSALVGVSIDAFGWSSPVFQAPVTLEAQNHALRARS